MEKCLRRNEFIPDPYGMGTVFLMTTISVTELSMTNHVDVSKDVDL